MPEYNVVYRGYNNLLAVSTRIKMNPKFIALTCDGSTLTHQENNEWILNPYTKVDSLEIVMFHSKTKKIIDRFIYKVRDLPDPKLFVGASGPNQLISKLETRLFARYDSGSPLSVYFMVTGGFVTVGDNNNHFKIDGHTLGEDYLDYVKSVPIGTKIKVEADVVGPDKVKRVIHSEYNF